MKQICQILTFPFAPSITRTVFIISHLLDKGRSGPPSCQMFLNISNTNLHTCPIRSYTAVSSHFPYNDVYIENCAQQKTFVASMLELTTYFISLLKLLRQNANCSMLSLVNHWRCWLLHLQLVTHYRCVHGVSSQPLSLLVRTPSPLNQSVGWY